MAGAMFLHIIQERHTRQQDKMGFGQKLKNFFFPPKTERYIVHPQKEMTKEMQKDYYTKKVLQENTALKAELARNNQEKARRKQEREEEKQLIEINNEIIKQAELDKKLQKSTTLFLPFKTIRKLPTVYTKTNKPLGKGAGFFVKPTREGIVLWYLAIKLKGKLQRINAYTQDPSRFFKSPLNWSSAVKTGKIDTNIDFIDGKPTIVEDKNIFEKFIEGNTGDKVKVLMMDEAERHDFEMKIQNMKERIKQYLSTIQDMAERETEYENTINELNARVISAEKDRDTYAASSTNLRNKDATKTEVLAQALDSNQDLKITSSVAEGTASKLQDVVDDLQDKLEQYIPEDKMGLAREEVEKSILRGVEIARNAQVPNKIVLTSEKEEAKKAEAQAKQQQKTGGLLRKR